MIEIQTSLGLARIVESVVELPRIPDTVHELFMDVESTSCDYDTPALHPYKGDRACGWAVTWDGEPGAWYVPIRHAHTRWNLPLQPVLEWLQALLRRTERWVNHNVKFDCHFALVDNLEFDHVDLICTLTRAKMINSDRWSHDLKPLLKEWLDLGITEDQEVRVYLESLGKKKCQDYGRVPADILGKYACVDVLGNRQLERYLVKERPAEQAKLWRREEHVTRELLHMEVAGLRVNRGATLLEKRACLIGMVEAQETVWTSLKCQLVDSNKCISEIMLGQLALPILAWGKPRKDGTKGPSFDADAMELYKTHPLVRSDPKTAVIVDAIHSYRSHSRFNSLFVSSFLDKVDERGFIHPNYKQLVRTGRMACSDPNSQQMSPRAKALIDPDEEGWAIVEADGSQMEFRVIVHAINDHDAIAAYREDPRTDFHQWVADIGHIKRKPAKTVNFSVAFGAGKKNVVGQLIGNEEVLAEVVAQVDALQLEGSARKDAIVMMCTQRAEEIWDQYHRTLPGIKPTAKRSEKLVKRSGFIRNPYMRRRHLPIKGARKAFNTWVQGTASDIMKERLVAVGPVIRSMGMKTTAVIHDAFKIDGPEEDLREAIPVINEVLEDVKQKFKVRFMWDFGISTVNWKEAKAG